MDILVGIFLVVFGLAVTFMGTSMFFFMLPLIGFLFGFFIGTAGVEAALGDAFLATAAGWIAGLLIGLLFALVSYFWWYAGVLLAAGSVGVTLATGLGQAIGLDGGVAQFILGVAGFVLFAGVTLALDLPIYLVITATAIAGANLAVLGVMLIFNQFDADEMAYSTAATIVRESWLWTLVAVVIAVIGAAFQLNARERLSLPRDRWVPITTA